MQTVTSISRGTGHSAEVRSGIRPIESGTAWQAMFPTPDRQDRIVLEDGEVSDTVTLMTGVVLRACSGFSAVDKNRLIFCQFLRF
jgi:hypothetical protein